MEPGSPALQAGSLPSEPQRIKRNLFLMVLGSGSPQHVQLMDLWSNWQKRRVVTGEAQTGPLSWQDLDAGRTWFFSGWEHFPGDQFCAISGTFLWVGKMAFFFFLKFHPLQSMMIPTRQ